MNVAFAIGVVVVDVVIEAKEQTQNAQFRNTKVLRLVSPPAVFVRCALAFCVLGVCVCVAFEYHICAYPPLASPCRGPLGYSYWRLHFPTTGQASSWRPHVFAGWHHWAYMITGVSCAHDWYSA